MTPSLRSLLDERVVLFDGAMGTALIDRHLDRAADYRGVGLCVDLLSITRPDVVREVHDGFLAVGCDAVGTNTFGASPLALARYGLSDEAREINVAAARIAREACDAAGGAPRFVVGSIGPGDRLPTLGQVDAQTLVDSYREQAEALVEGGVDALVLETCQDPAQIQAGLAAVMPAREVAGRDVPLFVSFTVEVTGKLLVGTAVDDVIALLEDSDVDLVAINCATGPREMEDHVRRLARRSTKKIGVYPNAGLPQIVDGETHYPLTPEELADWLERFVEQDGVRLVGGCCGTTPRHLDAVARALRSDEGGRRAAGDVKEQQVARRTPYRVKAPVPEAPFTGARAVEGIDLKSVLPYVDESALFQLHWDERRKGRSADDYEAFLANEARPTLHRLAEECARQRSIVPAAAYGYWPCRSDGEDLLILDSGGESEIGRLSLPRQVGKLGLCVADYFRTEPGEVDVVALQVVTLGGRATDVAAERFAAGETDDYRLLAGFYAAALDATAELIHRQIRGELGISGDDAREMQALLKKGYRGARFTFGSPPCPADALELVLHLVGADKIGVSLTHEGRFVPELTSAALVAHHPGAKYFAI